VGTLNTITGLYPRSSLKMRIILSALFAIIYASPVKLPRSAQKKTAVLKSGETFTTTASWKLLDGADTSQLDILAYYDSQILIKQNGLGSEATLFNQDIVPKADISLQYVYDNKTSEIAATFSLQSATTTYDSARISLEIQSGTQQETLETLVRIYQEGTFNVSAGPTEPIDTTNGNATDEVHLAHCLIEGAYPEIAQGAVTITIGGAEIQAEFRDGKYHAIDTLAAVTEKAELMDRQPISCQYKVFDDESLTNYISSGEAAGFEVLYSTTEAAVTTNANKEGDSYWAEKGKDYTVSCTGNGNPSPTLAVVGPDGSHDSPYSATATENADYTCTATQNGETISSAAQTVSVFYLEAPALSISPAKEEYIDGEAVVISCSATSNPAASYKLQKVNGEDVQEIDILGKEVSLSMEEDTGTYRCVANVHFSFADIEKVSTNVDIRVSPKTANIGLVIGIIIVVIAIIVIVGVLLWRKKNAEPKNAEPDSDSENEEAEPALPAESNGTAKPENA